MTESRHMPVAVESVGDRKAWVRTSLQTKNAPLEATALNEPRLSNLSQDAEEVLSGFLKITQRAMVRSRSWVNIPVCPCLYPSLKLPRNISPFENKVWEIHLFIKKCVRSFIEVGKLCLIVSSSICITAIQQVTCLKWAILYLVYTTISRQKSIIIITIMSCR